MVHFMEDAAEGTGYFKRVADKVLTYIDDAGYVCDAGCGLGHLSIEMAADCNWVDAIDKAPQAVEVLARMTALRGIRNVNPIVGDYECLAPARPYDAMVFCMSNSIEEAARIAVRACSNRVVVINRVKTPPRESSVTNRRGSRTFGKAAITSFDWKMNTLVKNGIECVGEYFIEEIGQPFRTLESAQQFFDVYRNRDYPDSISKNELVKILEPSQDERWQFYLPIQRQLGLFSFDRAAAEKIVLMADLDTRSLHGDTLSLVG